MIDWLTLCLLMISNGDTHSADQEQLQQSTSISAKTTSDETTESPPSKKLLLFLAEWDEIQDGQWIEPSAFAADSALGQQMDQRNQTNKSEKNENNPNHN